MKRRTKTRLKTRLYQVLFSLIMAAGLIVFTPPILERTLPTLAKFIAVAVRKTFGE